MPALRLQPDFEDALRRLPGIRAASVVTNGSAEPIEIHVLASLDKAPKQMVRDIQSLAMAQFDLEVDHRIISIVQFADEDIAAGGLPADSDATEDLNDRDDLAPAIPLSVATTPPLTAVPDLPVDDLAPPMSRTVAGSVVHTATAGANARILAWPDFAPTDSQPESLEATDNDDGLHAQRSPDGLRPQVRSFSVRISADQADAEVELIADGSTFVGRSDGSSTHSHRPRLIAEAALNALAELLGHRASIESVVLTPQGQRIVALCVVSVLDPRVGEVAYSGSALVRSDDGDAVVRAVLDALNRRLSG
ncbi:MAG TPA: hypothetical protein DHW34_03825 [Actinobacteria bacterium]|nr:hypothetical protein [Actinomycetota bacterium]